MSGDYFVYGLMMLNVGACVWYAWDGFWIKSFYWPCVVGLNYSLLRMK